MSPSSPLPSTMRSKIASMRGSLRGRAHFPQFVLREVHEKPRNLHHAGVLVHHDESAEPIIAPAFSVSQSPAEDRIHLWSGNRRRTADLRGLKRSSVPHTAADVE